MGIDNTVASYCSAVLLLADSALAASGAICITLHSTHHTTPHHTTLHQTLTGLSPRQLLVINNQGGSRLTGKKEKRMRGGRRQEDRIDVFRISVTTPTDTM